MLHALELEGHGFWTQIGTETFFPLITRNVETGRPRVILFIYFSLSPTENAREIAGEEGRIREERTVAINEPVKFPASVY